MFSPYAAILCFSPALYLFCLASICPNSGLHQKQHGHQTEGGDSLLLLCYCGTPPGGYIQLWDPQHKNNMELLKQVHRRATKLIRDWDTFPVCEDRLRKLELFCLEKRRLCGDLIATILNLKGAYS